MKKLLLGALGMAMATTAMAAESSTGVVNIPVTGNLTIGTPQTQETLIKLSADSLNFVGKLDVTKYNTIAAQRVTVSKVANGMETTLNKGDFKYKVAPDFKSWEDVKDYAKIDELDENYEVFKLKGQDEFVKLGGNRNLPFALKANAEDNGNLAVLLQGYVADQYNNKEATINAKLHVALVDSPVQP